jgi:hypothetical protein
LGCLEGWKMCGWGSIPYDSFQTNKEAMKISDKA